MNIFRYFTCEFNKILARLVAQSILPTGLDASRVVFELPREVSHGDLATNAAMVLAKAAQKSPKELASIFSIELSKVEGVVGVDIAGPGFINILIEPILWAQQISDIVHSGSNYGRSSIGTGSKINVEFVSANPTGPLHAAHARGAVVGDALASLMEFCGWQVTREYYINDAGGQVDVLAHSTYMRYCEALGRDIGAIPAGLYPGDYLKEIGAALVTKIGDRYFDRPEEDWLDDIRHFAIDRMIQGIKEDLTALGIHMDVFSSEKSIVQSGSVQRVIEQLRDAGYLYRGVLEPPKGKEPDDWEPREQLLFKASDFGDDTDRPLQKSDGSWTYFAADVAYHLDKLERTKGQLINIFGADHGGYVKRMNAAVAALSGKTGMLDIKLCQLVNLLDNGTPIKMSKRAGTFITVRDVIDNVGADVIRFIMLTRRNDQTLDFDFAKVTEQSKDNPVFYVQYAYARACSVLRRRTTQKNVDLALIKSEPELALIKQLASWPKLVESAALAHEPHRIAFYLVDLASHFHSLWNAGRDNPELRFIIDDEQFLTDARLMLVKATSLVIRTGLDVLSIDALEEM